MQQIEPQLTRLSDYKARLVESGGMPFWRLFSLDLSDGRFNRAITAKGLQNVRENPSFTNLFVQFVRALDL